jgi:hypothetical protein
MGRKDRHREVGMTDEITRWADHRSSQGLSLEHRDDGRVELLAVGVDGREARVTIPAHVWDRLAKEIGWNAPRRAAALEARRMGMAPELPRPA